MTDIKVPLNKLNINTYSTEIIVLSTKLYWGYYKHSLLKQWSTMLLNDKKVNRMKQEIIELKFGWNCVSKYVCDGNIHFH